MKVHKIIASLLFSAMLSFSTQGCAAERTTKDSLTIAIPEYTAMVVLFDAEGNVTFRDREGKPLPPCQFCDEKLARENNLSPRCEGANVCNEELEQKFGPGCEKAKGKYIYICPGTVSTDIKGVTPVSLYRTTGSTCYGGSAPSTNGGTCYDLCKTFGWGCPP